MSLKNNLTRSIYTYIFLYLIIEIGLMIEEEGAVLEGLFLLMTFPEMFILRLMYDYYGSKFYINRNKYTYESKRTTISMLKTFLEYNCGIIACFLIYEIVESTVLYGHKSHEEHNQIVVEHVSDKKNNDLSKINPHH